MFNQKAKSNRDKADPPPPPTSSSSSSSKGLLSFNTSNLTRIFRNSTNFVQSTFAGAGLTSQSDPQSSSTADAIEQSFTIPSIKKRNDATNSGAPKKERDILSTPVLIKPTAMTNTSSLSSLSSYKQITQDESIAAAAHTMSLKRNKIPSNIVTNVIVTISTADDNHKVSSSLHVQQSSHMTPKPMATAMANTNVRIDPPLPSSSSSPSTAVTQLRPQKCDTKSQKPQKPLEKTAATATLSPSIAHSPSGKTNNANILFETVKMNKQNPTITSNPSSAKIKSSSISLEYHTKNDETNRINERNMIQTKVTNITPILTPNNNSSKSIQNEMDNDLMKNDVRYSKNNESGNILNGVASEQRIKALSMNAPSYFIKSTASTANGTHSSQPNKNFHQNQQQKNIQMNDNVQTYVQNTSHITLPPPPPPPSYKQAKNSNSIKNDVISNCGIDTSTHKMSNNNLDSSLEENIRQMNTTTTMTTTTMATGTSTITKLSNENPFENKLNASMDTSIARITTNDHPNSVENIYANCVTQSMKVSNLDNYKQQDPNENIIGTCDGTNGEPIIVGPNNNYDTNIDCSNVCNNNSPIKNDKSNIQTTPDNTSFKTTDTHSTKTNSTISLSNLNAIAPTTTDLYDILEESDDDEHSAQLRYNRRWSSSCSLYNPKQTDNNHFVPSSSSFAAAIAFANRNPFLQLDPMAKNNEPLIITTSTKSPILAIGGSNMAATAAAVCELNNISNTMGFTVTNNGFTQSTLTMSNCANIPNHFPFESYASFVNDFIDESDFQFNSISSIQTPTATTTTTPPMDITDDVMNAILLILKEYGKDDIKQFMQVILSDSRFRDPYFEVS